MKIKEYERSFSKMISYYPILNIATAEMNAYASLKEDTKKSIIPILESKKISPNNKDTWQTTFNTLGSYLKSKLSQHKFIYDYKPAYDKIGEIEEGMVNEKDQDLITHCSEKMIDHNLNFIPTIHYDSPEWYINSIVNLEREEVAIRVRSHDFNSTLDNIILQTINSNIISKLDKITKRYYIIIDFSNKPTSNDRMRKAISTFSQINNSEVVLSTTTCPEDASNIGAMSFDIASPRNDLKSYNLLLNEFPQLKFSDYTVRSNLGPDREAKIDYYNTYIKIFYSTEDSYMIGKSSLIKDNGIENFHSICQEIIDSDLFSGENFSDGDKAINSCANKSLIINNHSKPIEYGINHHIELTSTQLRHNLRVFNAS